MHSDHLFMRSWWVLALRGLAAIAFGVITLVLPGVTVLSLLMVFAAYALLGGGASVVGAFSNRKHGGDWWALLLLGICGLAVGILTIIYPLLTTFALIVLIGVNALISGVFDIVLAIRLRKAIQGEWLLVLNAIVSIAFGILILILIVMYWGGTPERLEAFRSGGKRWVRLVMGIVMVALGAAMLLGIL